MEKYLKQILYFSMFKNFLLIKKVEKNKITKVKKYQRESPRFVMFLKNSLRYTEPGPYPNLQVLFHSIPLDDYILKE